MSVPALVAAVNTGHIDGARAAKSLFHLLVNDANDANMAAIVAADGIPSLIGLLRHGGVKGKQHAAATIALLVKHNDANQVAIAEADGIVPLIALLRGGPSSSKDAKHFAAAALLFLAQNNNTDVAAAIAAAGGVAPLARFARIGKGDATVFATRALVLVRAIPAEQVEAVRVAAERKRQAAAARAAAARAEAERINTRKAARDARRLLRLQALGVRCLQALGIDEHMPAPKDYTCPITATGEAMIDPVVDALGITYERAAIERWLKDHNTSPLSMKKLPDKRLVPNFALWSIIEDWEKKEHEKYMALATA